MGAGYFLIADGGTVRLSVNPAGNVGIGTSTVDAALDIYGVTTANSALIVPRSTTATRPYWNATNGMIRYNTNTSKFEAYENGAWTNMTATGASGYVDGGNSNGANSSIGLNDAYRLDVETAGTARMSIDQAGNVGIGTTNPGGILDVAYGTAGTSGHMNMKVMGNAAAADSYSLGVYTGATGRIHTTSEEGSNRQAMVFADAGSASDTIWGLASSVNSGTTWLPRLVVKQSGSVGIGTATPQAALDVRGTGVAYSALIVPRDTTALRPTSAVNGMIRYNSSTNKFEAYENGAWANMTSSGSDGFVNGGNSFLSNATLGTTDNYTLGIKTNNTTRMTIDALGNVGIGTSTPGQKLSVWGTSSAASGSVYNVYSNLDVNLTSSSSATFYGQHNYVDSSGAGANNIGGLAAGYMATYHNGSGHVTNLWSTYNLARNNSTGTIGTMFGAMNYAYNASSGSMTNAYGAENRVTNSATGTMTSAVGTVSRVYGGGTITNAYGVLVDFNSTGTTTNAYGVYVSDVQGTNAYGFYQLDATDKNYFAGAVGIGTTSPAAILDVRGTGTFQSAIIVPRDTTALRPYGVNGMIRYNSATNKFEAYENGNWTNMTATGASGYINGGNSNGANSTVGLNDAYRLDLETAGTARISLDALGNVGIGTTSPVSRLTIGENSTSSEVITVQSDGAFAGLDLKGDTGNNGGDPGGAYVKLSQDGGTVNGSFSLNQSPGGDGMGGSMTNSLLNSVLVSNNYAGALQLATNASVRMTVSPTGLIGIGTTAPQATLDVSGTGTGNSGMIVPRDTTALRPYGVNGMIRYNTATNKFEFYENAQWSNYTSAASGFVNGGNAFLSNATLGTTDYYTLSLMTNNSTRMTINTAGNVGIGTTSPSRLLHVNGTAAVGNPTAAVTMYGVGSVGYVAGIKSDNSGYNDLFLQTGNSPAGLYLSTLGFAGLGTTNPTQKLDLRGVFRIANTDFAAGTTGTFLDSSLGAASGNTYAQLQAYTDGGVSPGFIVLNAVGGNVGIGTTAPTVQHHVHSSGIGGVFSLYTNADSGATSSDGLIVGINSVEEGIVNVKEAKSLHLQTADTVRMTIDASGKVGIGTTTPTTLLEVYNTNTATSLGSSTIRVTTNYLGALPGSGGSIDFNHTAGTQAARIRSYTFGVALTGLAFDTGWNGPTTKMVIDNMGNVGIGSTSPQAGLDNATGSLILTNTNFTNYMELGQGLISNQNAYIDLHGDTTYSDYGFRLIRANTGANANSSLIHRGTGGFYLTAQDAGAVILSTSASERMRIDSLGNVAIGTNSASQMLEVAGNVKASSFISTSDRRLKTDIRPADGLATLLRLNGVQYNWRANGQHDHGVIAQEVEAVLPDAVVTDERSGLKAVKYQNLISPMIESIKEIYGMCRKSDEAVHELKRELASKSGEIVQLKDENSRLKEKLDNLMQRMEKVESVLQKQAPR